jgi:hypothetical protein
MSLFRRKDLILDPDRPLGDSVRMVLNETLRQRLLLELEKNVRRQGSRAAHYMFAGPDRTALCPAIVIFCQTKREKRAISRYCSRLEWLVDILRKHRFKLHIMVEEIRLSGKTETGMAEDTLGLADCILTVSPAASTICGATVRVPRYGKQTPTVSSFGGFIIIGNTLYGTLARHPFESSPTSATLLCTEKSESGLSSDEGSISSAEDDEMPFTLSFDDVDDAEMCNSLEASASTTISRSTNYRYYPQLSNLEANCLSIGLNVLIPRRTPDEDSILSPDPDLAFADLHRLQPDILGKVLLPNKAIDQDIKDFMIDLPRQHCSVTILAAGIGPQMGNLNPEPASLQFGASSHDVRLVTTECHLRKVSQFIR